MKPFEERYTEWIDGRLNGAELEAFMRELPDQAAADLDRTQAQGLGRLLREQPAPVLSNPDFFAQQLLERIAETEQPVQPASTSRGWSFFTLPNMAWAGACCALMASAIYFATFFPGSRPPGLASRPEPGQASLPITAVHVASTSPAVGAAEGVYDASIIEATPVEPGVSASVYSQAENVTVLWLDGLDYLPASYNLQ